jgi:hypothetical protein
MSYSCSTASIRCEGFGVIRGVCGDMGGDAIEDPPTQMVHFSIVRELDPPMPVALGGLESTYLF